MAEEIEFRTAAKSFLQEFQLREFMNKHENKDFTKSYKYGSVVYKNKLPAQYSCEWCWFACLDTLKIPNLTHMAIGKDSWRYLLLACILMFCSAYENIRVMYEQIWQKMCADDDWFWPNKMIRIQQIPFCLEFLLLFYTFF